MSGIIDRTTYNRRVMAWLERHAPAHARELNARGTARGWWDQVNWFRVTRKPVELCGLSIQANRLEPDPAGWDHV